MPSTPFTRTFPLLIMGFFLSCSGEKERVVAETNRPHVRLLETTLYAKPAEDPFAFFKKKHRSYDLEIVNDSTKRYPVAYERAYHDPEPWQLLASNEIVAYRKSNEDWTVVPLMAPRCGTRIPAFDPAGELTIEKYAYYWMGCEPVLVVQHVSPSKAVEVLEQTWAEPCDGYEITNDPWMKAFKILSTESQKKVRVKMIEIHSSLTVQEKENESPDFKRRLELLQNSSK